MTARKSPTTCETRGMPIHGSLCPASEPGTRALFLASVGIFLFTILFLVASRPAHATDFDPKVASFDELFAAAQRYGNTPERRRRKEAACAELHARKTDSLRYLMQGVHTENMYYGMYAEQTMDGMATNDIVEVLLPFLKSEHKETRRLAVYFLGKRCTPEHTALILPFLDDEDAAGSAIRTLGKWHATNALDRIASFLSDAKERRRILAANALGDIGDPRCIPSLLHALSDPVFTVRKAAARALTSLGPPVESQLVDAFNGTTAPARREIVQIMGAIRSKYAVPVLRGLLNDPDRETRSDAAIALKEISPIDTPAWIKGSKAEDAVTSTGLISNE